MQVVEGESEKRKLKVKVAILYQMEIAVLKVRVVQFPYFSGVFSDLVYLLKMKKSQQKSHIVSGFSSGKKTKK